MASVGSDPKAVRRCGELKVLYQLDTTRPCRIFFEGAGVATCKPVRKSAVGGTGDAVDLDVVDGGDGQGHDWLAGRLKRSLGKSRQALRLFTTPAALYTF